MTPYIITVAFHLRLGCLPAFLPLIRENARRSLTEEPGCRRFDVLLEHDGGNVVFLYEIYDDERSFVAHCQTPHFVDFDRASRDLYDKKIVQRYRQVESVEATEAR